jgi:hypothetical protein
MYMQVAAPEAEYLNGTCYGEFGPRSITYYPYHGIYISVQLDSEPVTLALHVPAGIVVQLDDPTLRIHGLSREGAFDAVLRLRANRHAGLANAGPPRIFLSADPYTTPDNFGPLWGADNHGPLQWYEFLATGQLTKGAISGTLELPSLTINGQRYESQVLVFSRKRFVGFTPINC